MVEMSHHEFLEVLDQARENGTLLFKTQGQRYTGPIERVYAAKHGKTVIVMSCLYVLSQDGNWAELEDSCERYVTFDWLTARYSRAENGTICVRTVEGPIYFLIGIIEPTREESAPAA